VIRTGTSALTVDELDSSHGAVLSRRPPARVPSARVRLAAETLHDDPRRGWTLPALAAHVGLHPSHLARAFRAAHGCTIGAYLRRLRLDAVARALALGEASIADLANEFGFADQSHCGRAFRRWLGTTPGLPRLSRLIGPAATARVRRCCRPHPRDCGHR
jgi:AraC-like DNA-binding protein